MWPKVRKNSVNKGHIEVSWNGGRKGINANVLNKCVVFISIVIKSNGVGGYTAVVVEERKEGKYSGE